MRQATINRNQRDATCSVHPERVILFAVLGMAPAVLTETVWALAHSRPPVIPDLIVAVTTRLARARLCKLLFDFGGWQRLLDALRQSRRLIAGRLRFGPAHDHIRLLPKPGGRGDLDDICSGADNEAAADCILRSLREFAADPQTQIIASIAGGRKTMSALLTSCMIILGRSQDRLCHVLVAPPYDRPDLNPPFLFPERGVRHRLPGISRAYPSLKARVELADIPFVRFCGWYEREFAKLPTSYMELVKAMQPRVFSKGDYPEIEVRMAEGCLTVAGRRITLSAAEFALLVTILQNIKAGSLPQGWARIGEDFQRLCAAPGAWADTAWMRKIRELPWDVKEDTRKRASSLRAKLRRALGDPRLVDALAPAPRGPQFETYPVGRIVIR